MFSLKKATQIIFEIWQRKQTNYLDQKKHESHLTKSKVKFTHYANIRYLLESSDNRNRRDKLM